MFTGTLRFNLDPEGLVHDQEIVSLLIKAELESILKSSDKGLYQMLSEGG
jgi:ABC-type transport system involved in cytochrome bd biosynthesis fused ATPase/permease subunit